MYALLSQDGQSAVRKIDQVFIRESQSKTREVWSFDICEIPPLPEEDDNEDEQNGLTDEKVAREIGAYVVHEDYDEDNLDENFGPGESDKYKNLSEIQ